MKPAFKHNQPETEYRAAKPELSQSIIKTMLAQSPAHGSMSDLLNALNAPATQKPQTLPAMLKQHQPRFKAIAPRDVDVTRFSAALMADVRSNQKLAECNPMTVLGRVHSLHTIGP